MHTTTALCTHVYTLAYFTYALMPIQELNVLVDEWNHHKGFLAQQEKRIVDTKDQFRAREQILMEREKADFTRTQNVAEVNGPSKSPAPRERQISNTNHCKD